MSTKETIAGIIENKLPSKSDKEKAPKGNVYVDEKRLTIWDQEIWDAVEKDKSYTFLCTVTESEYNGKKYTNRNVVSGMPDEPLEKSDLEVEGFAVIIDDSVKEIHMPKVVVEFLKTVIL